MTQAEALADMAQLIERIGKMAAIERIARDAGVPPTTVYGWWRRGSVPEWRIKSQRMQNMLIRLYNDEVLSEGQVARVTGLDRIAIRMRADELRSRKSAFRVQP